MNGSRHAPGIAVRRPAGVWAWFLAAALLSGSVRTLAQDGDLTLDQVIRMNAEGVPEDALIERIASSGVTFVLDGPALAKVQRSQLPARVIVALMKTSQTGSDDPAPSRPTSGAFDDKPGAPADSHTLPPEGPHRAAGETLSGAVPGVPEGWTLFRQTDGRFAIHMPADWKVVSSRNGRSTVQAEAFEMGLVPPDEVEDLSRLRRFFLITWLPRKTETPLPTTEEWLSSFCHKLQRLEPGYQLSADEVIELADGTSAGRVVAQGIPRDAAAPMRVVFYGLPLERGFFLIRHGGVQEGLEGLEDTFARMIDSFRLTAPAPEAPPTAPDLLAGRVKPFPYGTTPTDPGRPGGESAREPATEPTPTLAEPTRASEPARPVIPADPAPVTEGLPIATPQGAPERPVPSFAEFSEPDGRFAIQYPAGWKRADLVTPDGIAWYFSPHPYNPRSGKPFTNGVSVTVQTNVYSDPGASEGMARLASAGEGVRRQFVLAQEASRSLVRVHDPALLPLAGDHPSLVYRYTLTYPNGGDELGFFVVAIQGDWILVAEANAPREQYFEVQDVLLRVVESLSPQNP